MTVSIVLADDHPLVRRGMRALLEGKADFSVVGSQGGARARRSREQCARQE